MTYESIGEMKYMDQVIDESMRVYPPVQFTDRVASCDFTYDASGIRIRKGQVSEVKRFKRNQYKLILLNF